MSNHFADDLKIIEKYREGKIWSAAYYDAEQNYYYLKRFLIEQGTRETRFIGEHPESRLIRITEVEYPRLELKFGGKNKDRNSEIIEVADFIGIKSYKARGKRLSNYEVKVIEELQPEIEAVENEPEALPPKVPKEKAKEKKAKPKGKEAIHKGKEAGTRKKADTEKKAEAVKKATTETKAEALKKS